MGLLLTQDTHTTFRTQLEVSPRENLPDKILYRDDDWFQKRNNNILGMGDIIAEKEDPGPLVTCKVCNRSFAADRIQKHTLVCDQITSKPRSVYDVVRARISGTEAEDLVNTGRMTLEQARPNVKKSEMTRLMEESKKERENKSKQAVRKPIKEKPKATVKGTSGEAYQVMFDDSGKMQKRKQTAMVMSSRMLPTQVVRQKGEIMKNSRYLSPISRSHTKTRISPDFPCSLPSSSLSDEDYDFLAASMASAKSDAFDFLFDEKNLEPENVHQHLDAFNRPDSRKEQKIAVAEKESECCIIV